MTDYARLLTEQGNPKSINIDKKPIPQILDIINSEDASVADAVSRAKPSIVKAIEIIISALSKGGRLFFIGAGTSGRLGVMEAAECPPTFNTNPKLIQAIIAGGKGAVWHSIEGAEDNLKDGKLQISKHHIKLQDVVVGIAASSVTPFVMGALAYAKMIGCHTIFITCAKLRGKVADITIAPLTGPEVITGSTRMKAGTATKMVLNMLTTASMIKLGKVYQNLMIDLQPKSRKLRERAIRIIMVLAKTNRRSAVSYLRRAKNRVRDAIIMAIKDSKDKAVT